MADARTHPMKIHKRPQKEDSDFKFPPEALNSSAVLDTRDIARGFASCIPHLPEDCREAHSLALDILNQMTRRFPDGVAPRDLPPSEAQLLLMAWLVASVVGGKFYMNTVGKN